MPIVVCHGGSASNPDHEDGPRQACLAGGKAVARHECALDAVIAATKLLEDDERFNAGAEPTLRLDGSPQQTVDWLRNQLAEGVDVGVIVVYHTGFAGGACHGMAWHEQSIKAPA